MRSFCAWTGVFLAVVTFVACEDDTKSPPSGSAPDASIAIDSSVPDSGSPPQDDSGVSGCAGGVTPSASMKTAAVFIPGGWRLWGYLNGGKEEAETQACEQAKGFYITPVINPANPTPTEAETDAAACAMQSGTRLPFGDFGYNDDACGTLPCSGAKFFLAMDPDGQRGEITTELANGTKQHYSRLWVKGDKILINDSGSSGALYTKAGNAFVCTAVAGGS